MVIDKKDVKEEEEEIILDTDISDEEEDEPQEIEVDIEPEKEEEEDAPGTKAFAEMRIENKELKQSVKELTDSVKELTVEKTPEIAPQPGPVEGDQADPRNWSDQKWDDLAKTDWRKAVDLRSKMQAEEIQTQATHTSEFNKVLEESKQKVLIRHPELNDPNSEKAKVYRNIVVANPEYTGQKKGPLTAMYEMEEYMEKNLGYKREDIVKAETAARADEASRQSRVQLSTAGHNISEGNKVTITKDEMEFCKLQGIDPKLYATNKKKLAGASKGEIQL